MPAILEPVLEACRDLYGIENVMQRFRAYVHLMTAARGEFLPLGAFSPMGKRQQSFLDALLTLHAEDHAASVAQDAMQELQSTQTHRVALVVVDEPRNGWTQRHLTDADWRFSTGTDGMPKNNTPRLACNRWVSVQLWTTTFDGATREASLQYVRQETRAALARAHHQAQHAHPKTLEQMMRQEAFTLRFSGQRLETSLEELDYNRNVIEPLLNNTHYPSNFAAMYGDEAAKNVGFAPLGLSSLAGFALALEMF